MVSIRLLASVGAGLSAASLRARIAALLSLVLFPAGAALAQGRGNAAGPCDEASLAVMPAPVAPWKGAPLRLIIAAEKAADGQLSLVAPDGSVAASSQERHGGPPYFWFVEVATPAAGTWVARLERGGCSPFTAEIPVAAVQPPQPRGADDNLWPVRAAWNRATENMFSAWIEKLFDDPIDAEPSWPALHLVLRDRQRNFLFNYLGLNEDQTGMGLRPDCADLPYFLRAYFAFKMGLPFGYSKCSRGGGGQPPRCSAWYSIHNLEPPPRPAQPAEPAETTGLGPFSPRVVQAPAAPATPALTVSAARRSGLVSAFTRYVTGQVADGVHSATMRTALADENTDVYPVPLSQDTLRPGTVYADPYGHILMIVRRIAQTETDAGIIFAVDGQPDGTVARKRFWRGNFLYVLNPALGGPGFKHFRPIVRERSGALRRMTNAEIGRNPDYADFALDQARLGADDFYDRMEDVLSPQPLDPRHAMKAVIEALEEQVRTRVTSVENGRKFLASGRGEAPMPDGPTIFETTGAWEDFSTPSRDMRLLIAIDVARGFPDHVMRRPDRYAIPAGRSLDAVKAELASTLASELPSRKFSYTRSDGSQWTLSLQDVLDRAPALEMAYNPNDCVELRWGAAERSEEAATCKRHAPSGQRAKMAGYRSWFHDRRRPPRA